jgi:hypothetical protein
LPSLRVLFFATRDWYHPATTGADITMWENARYLASKGHDVTFVAASFPGASRQETLDSIKVIRLGGIHSLWLRTIASRSGRRDRSPNSAGPDLHRRRSHRGTGRVSLLLLADMGRVKANEGMLDAAGRKVQRDIRRRIPGPAAPTPST